MWFVFYVQVKQLIRKRKAPKPRVDVAKAKKITRTVDYNAAKCLLDLHATLPSRSEQEMLATECLLNLGNDKIPECPVILLPDLDILTSEATANTENPQCPPECLKESQDGNNDTSVSPQENTPKNVGTQV